MKHLRIVELIDRINGVNDRHTFIVKVANGKYMALSKLLLTVDDPLYTEEGITHLWIEAYSSRKKIINIAHRLGLITPEEMDMIKKSEKEGLE